MKLYCFGTCAGTEPIKERKHVSFALEINGIFVDLRKIEIHMLLFINFLNHY